MSPRAIAAALLLAAALLAGPAPGVPLPEAPAGPVVAAPGYARFVTVEGERPGTVAQTLWALDGSDFTVEGAASPHPFVGVRWREARPEEREPEASGRQWVVEATIGADAPVGPFGGVLAISLSHPRQERLLVPVSGLVRPMYAITPPAARFLPLAAGETASARFFVRCFTTAPGRLTGAASALPGVAASLAEEEAGRGWWLTVTLGPGLPPGPFGGTVTVVTATPGKPFLELPITGVVVGP